jgi:hypothetical protein
VCSRDARLTLTLRNSATSGASRGSVTVRSGAVAGCSDVLHVTFQGQRLAKKNSSFFGDGKSDPFLVISRVLENGSTVVVHRTEPVMKTLDPVWKRDSLPVQLLCNGDVTRPIVIECFDWEKVRGCAAVSR